MTNDSFVFNRLSDAGVPVAKLSWGPASCTPALPYAVYQKQPHSEYADNTNLPEIPRYRASIYTAEADDPMIERFRQQIADMGTYVAFPGEYDDERRAFVHEFAFTLVRKDA